MTRALVGLTMRSVEALGGEVSLPQFRLLLVLSGLGRVASSRLAAEMGAVVTLEVTPAGVELVARVVTRRQELLAGVLDQMTG